MTHPNEEMLNDYVDELLSESETLEVRRHLDSCPDCRSDVESIRNLLHQATQLSDIEPDRDLLDAVRVRARKPSYGWTRWLAAAAAVGLVAIFAGLELGRDNGETAVGPSGKVEPSFETLLANFEAAEAEYIRATESLAEGLEARRDEIEPETLAVLDKNLAVVDTAIAEVRLALGRDGVTFENSHILTALYNRKLDILLRASRLRS
ncbi:MAG: zf-HC2 domain-containing protein [Acidobacteriota bacterium]|nr:zf-HC2 domain-containing protein [Acidobacteriota bacterium]MDH3786584.1 zf-HC2 domain-containing protein [Acidobacteriota bacterium]